MKNCIALLQHPSKETQVYIKGVDLILHYYSGKRWTYIKTLYCFTLNPLPQPVAGQDTSPSAPSVSIVSKNTLLEEWSRPGIRMMSLHKHQICLPIHLLLNLLPQLSDLCQLEVSCQLLLQPQLGPTDVLVYPVPSIIQITLVGDWTFAQCTTTKYNMSNSYWRRAFRVQKHHP